MIEVWKDIPGYEGMYAVSNLGRVRSLFRRHAKFVGVMSTFVHTGGYVYVNLSKNGVKKSKRVHRLVAEAFVENPNGYRIVNHIDEDKTNNCADNLEWCTQSHNINHGTRNKRLAETRKRKSKGFICVETGEIYHSQAECASDLGITKPHLNSVLKGKRKSTGGFHFKYLEGQS